MKRFIYWFDVIVTASNVPVLVRTKNRKTGRQMPRYRKMIAIIIAWRWRSIGWCDVVEPHLTWAVLETPWSRWRKPDWSGKLNSHPSLQRTEASLSGKYHTGREEGSAKSHEESKEDHGDKPFFHGMCVWAALQEKSRGYLQRPTPPSSLCSDTKTARTVWDTAE